MGSLWSPESLRQFCGKLLWLEGGYFVTLLAVPRAGWALYNRRMRPRVDGLVAAGDDWQMPKTLNRAGAVPATTPMAFQEALAGLGSLDTAVRFAGTPVPLTPDELLARPPAPLETVVALRFNVERDRERRVAGRVVFPDGRTIAFGPG